jgi:PhzF family phenazine biosynthesis protein
VTQYAFRIVNVFTRGSDPFSGNPLCVFEDAAGLDTATMQALARQFNLSETTFILPSQSADARVRIFTPAYEMPFAGHPTLGTAHVCRALGLGGDSLALEMQAGTIAVAASGNRWTLTALPPEWRELGVPEATIADALGLIPADLSPRPLWVTTGREQLVVPLRSADAVQRVAPRAAALLKLFPGSAMVYVVAVTAPGRMTEPTRTVARFFFPQDESLLEDPATGSATANFGGWCLGIGRPLPQRYEISQGDRVERPSTLHLEVDVDRTIRVSGSVAEIGSGRINLD